MVSVGLDRLTPICELIVLTSMILFCRTKLDTLLN